MMKKRNVIWILGEATRNYPGKDHYSIYDTILELSKEGILFQNMVATAPSTLMSQSSIMTSQPPTHLARVYTDFSYDAEVFPSLSIILKKHGYHIYATTH